MGFNPEFLSNIIPSRKEEPAPKKERGFRKIKHQEGRVIFEQQHNKRIERENEIIENGFRHNEPNPTKPDTFDIP